MLEITIPGDELWDEEKQEFIYTKEQTLRLEHSLVSLSKWESKWCKPYITKADKTPEETIDYFKCMTLTKNVDPEVYNRIPQGIYNQIIDYINAPMTATRFAEDRNGKSNSEQITSELIYYWMIAHNIPVEFQKWHLNRLLTLIRVCNIKNQPPKKMNKKDILSRNARLNAERRAKLNSKG